ncbi:MAG: ShlB family hemolysin secretion/activation protein [Pseudomonadales bacterium RIFCSPLOWO2_12_59_9]|nr:MAG: ShlB family hemolysin secretion/activation protein [Pseudomonadales bacterium RIFCSPLOWO2_12_59_9]
MLFLRHLCALSTLCVLLCGAASAASLPPSPGDQDLIRQRQERLLEQQQQRLNDLQQLPQVTPTTPVTPSAPDSRCFDIQRITLKGAEHLSESVRNELVAPFLGKCLGAGQLNELLKVITNQYIDRGDVTTRAYLPQQDLSDGELEIMVVEGKLEGLESSEVVSPRELGMTFPGQVGEVLNLRDLEQLVDQVNRLPSRQAQMELLPGQEVGGSRVQLKGQRDKPWRVNFNRNNDGQDSTGEQQWGAGLDWDSPLGLADQLNLRAGGDTVSDTWRHSNNQSLGYSLPYGWWTFNYNYSQNLYRSLGQASNFDFEQKGDSKTQQLRAERVLHRDSVSKTAASLGVSETSTRNYIEDSLVDVSSQDLSESQVGFNHGRRIGSAFVNLDAGWQRGIGLFGADANNHPQGAEPVARYNKYSLTLSYLQPFQLWDESFSVDSLATGQQSEDVLFSPQRISIGGLSSVRGFKEQSLSGDSGGYWRNQLRWRRPIAWTSLQPWLQEYGATLAYDVGVIEHGPFNPVAHGRMSGNALELSARGQYLAASVTFSQSLERPSYITEPESPMYFRVEAFF